MFKVAYVIEVDGSDYPITVTSGSVRSIAMKVDDDEPIEMTKEQAVDLRDAFTEAIKTTKDPQKPKAEKVAKA